MHPSSGQPPEYGGSPQPPGQGQQPGWGPPPPADPYAAPPNDPYAPPATPHSEPTMLDAFGRQPGQDPFAPPPGYDAFGAPPGQQPPPPPGPVSPGHYPAPGMYPLSPAPGTMPPGMVPPPAYGPPPGQSKTNGFALAALILGILAPCGGALLSLIFGFVALSQIKKRGQRGRGMAIGGIVATVAWLLIGGIVLIIAVAFAPDDGGGNVPSTNLRVGDCVEQVPQSATVISLPTVPCSTPHEAEVYALFDLADGSFPGDSAIVTQAEDGCRVRLEAGFPDAFNDPTIETYYLYPTSSSWEEGDREVVCMAYYSDGPRTGSLGG